MPRANSPALALLAHAIPGPYAIQHDHLLGLAAACEQFATVRPMDDAMRAMDGHAVLRMEEEAPGVARLDLHGPLLWTVPWWARFYGIELTSTKELTEVATAFAAAPGSITTLILDINSPGGTVTGLESAAAAIDTVRAAGVRVVARVSGLCCSAAYWLACSADEIQAGTTAIVGSIGVYALLCDSTAADAAEGLAYEVISDGPLKGAGADGAITDDVRTETRALITSLATAFRSRVALYRGLDAAAMAAIPAGRVWLGADAAAVGLVDVVSGLLPDEAQGEIPSETPEDDDPQEDDTDAAASAPDPQGPAEDDDSQAAGGLAGDDAPAAGADDPAPPAAAQPGPAPTLTVAEVAALIARHPRHAAAIATQAAAGASMPQILESLLESATTTSRADAWAARVQAVPDPGADDSAAARAADPTSDDALRATWAAMSAQDRAGWCNDFDLFAWNSRHSSRRKSTTH